MADPGNGKHRQAQISISTINIFCLFCNKQKQFQHIYLERDLRNCNLPLFDLRVFIILRFLEPPGEENKVLLEDTFWGEENRAPGKRNTVKDYSFSGEENRAPFTGELGNDLSVFVLIGLSFPIRILIGEYIT